MQNKYLEKRPGPEKYLRLVFALYAIRGEISRRRVHELRTGLSRKSLLSKRSKFKKQSVVVGLPSYRLSPTRKKSTVIVVVYFKLN